VGKGSRGVSKFALVASAVSASSWRFRGRGARARTFERRAPRDVDACETLAVREHIQRPCGSEQSKYRQRCQEVQVSDGLGHQMQLQSFSGPTTDDVPVRAEQNHKMSVSSLVHFASGSNEPGEGGRGAQQDFGVSASVQLLLVASAVSTSSWRNTHHLSPFGFRSCSTPGS